MTDSLRKRVCPGHDFWRARVSLTGAPPGLGRQGRATTPEKKLQVSDWTVKKSGRKLGMTRILPAGARLSRRIYKICTLLSTGFVDNGIPSAQAAPRKALAGAAFAGGTARHWESVNDVQWACG